MKFSIDTQLPPRLAKFLSGKGFDANYTSRYPEGYFLDDAAIRRIAMAEERTIITKDSDFFDHFLVKGHLLVFFYFAWGISAILNY